MNSMLYFGIRNKNQNVPPVYVRFTARFTLAMLFFFFLFQHTLVTYSYQSVITFGGCRDDFMVVTSQQKEPGVGKKSVEKLVFAMAKPKVGFNEYICTNVQSE